MEQTGIVEECNDGMAKVKVLRSSACGDSCASCGMCANKETVIEARNDCGAHKGDRVLLNMSSGKVLNAAFLAYIVPVILLVLGCVAGDYIFGGETAGILCGFALMIVSFIVMHLLDKRLRSRYCPSISGIIRTLQTEEKNV